MPASGAWLALYAAATAAIAKLVDSRVPEPYLDEVRSCVV